MPSRNASGEYGVWDRTYDRWVLNAEFIKEPRAKRIAFVMNKSS